MEQTDELVLYKEYRPRGLVLLTEAREPAALPTIRALMDACAKDARIKALYIIAEPVAQKPLAKDAKRAGFGEMENTDALKKIEADTAIALVGLKSGDALLYTAKEKYKAKKLAYITTGLRSLDIDPKAATHPDIDIVFTLDELCAELYRRFLPWIDPFSIVPTGTPLSDALAAEDTGLPALGRNELEIPPNAVVAFFSAFPSQDLAAFNGGTRSSVEALKETLAGMHEAAAEGPAREFMLMVRPHPRAGAEESADLLKASVSALPNLRIVVDPTLSYEKALNAADVVCCIASSSVADLSRYRGQQALIMAYQGSGCGALFDAFFTAEDEALLNCTAGIRVAHSAGDVKEAMVAAQRSPRLEVPDDSMEKILGRLV